MTATALRALVTGGGGFLGRAICEQLRAAGWEVRSLSRGEHAELAALRVEHVRAGIDDVRAVCRACAGCDVVIHAAAKAGIWGPLREYYQANVTGTETVVQACLAAGVPRLVHTSSPSVVFDGNDMEGADESAPYASKHASRYSATKALAEQCVLAANGPRLATCALRPHLVWGPRDAHIVPRILRKARAGRLRIVGDGRNRVDVTYVDNAARAHLLAADALARGAGAAGRAYFISQGEPVNAWEFINRLLACANLPPLQRRISHAAARTAGAVCEFAYALISARSEPPMTRFLADELARSHWFDISAARLRLGYEPVVTIEEGLQRLRQWLASSPDGR